jgi:type III pantothenate kinase
MHESLSQRAAGLPLSDGEPMAFPDSTASAIATGVLDAQAGLIERVWTRFAQRLGALPQVLLAGGSASLLAAALPAAMRASIEDNLVLRGIALRLATE